MIMYFKYWKRDEASCAVSQHADLMVWLYFKMRDSRV